MTALTPCLVCGRDTEGVIWCRVIEYTCDHVNYDHATATALTNLYLTAKAALEADHE